MKYLASLVFLFATGGLFAQLGSPQPEPGFLVMPYLQYSTQSSMTVLWETREEATTMVEYGEALLGASSPNLSQSVKVEGMRQMHEVVLPELKAETNYFWRATSQTAAGVRVMSPVYSFKTAVKDSTAFMFALIGDTQRNDDTPWAWSVISKQVWRTRPNFIVLAGDLVDWGPSKEDWTGHFFPGGYPLMARIPMFTVLGNHEGDADFYYQYMANPRPEYYYSFTYGNAEFFMIDSNRDLSEGSEQYNWLDQALAKSAAVWKIVVHHHPPYSSDSDDHGNTYTGLSTLGTHARNLVPLLDKYHVDFDLFGHTHLYERSWPLTNDRINEKDGTIYINSGGAGGYVEAFAPTRSWFTLEQREGHHFCTFAIYDHSLVFKAIDYEGRVFDAFELRKPGGQGQAAVVSPPGPIIRSNRTVFHDTVKVALSPGLEGLSLYYTLDGSEPTINSTRYTAPFVLNANATVKARAFTAEGLAGRVTTTAFTRMAPLPAVEVRRTEPGLKFAAYQGDWRKDKQGIFASEYLLRQGVANSISLSHAEPVDAEYWAMNLTGYFRAPETGTYTFYAVDSRGLEVRFDDKLIFNSDEEGGKTMSVVLEKGLHKLDIRSWQQSGRKSLGFGLVDGESGRRPIAPFQLSH